MAKKSKKPPFKKETPPNPQVTGVATRFVPPWQSGIPGAIPFDEPDPDKVYNFDHVPERTKAIRRMFVSEFIKDFSPAHAILRLGFEYAYPAIEGNKWLKEPYTQHILDKHIRNVEEDGIVTRTQIILGLLEEANAHGLDTTGAARVAAWGKLAKIKGMEIIKVEHDHNVSGGIMLVPLAASPDQWEQNAIEAQAELRSHAKSA